MMFHVVTAGRCWLEVEGVEPRWLEKGSLALVPHGAGHRLLSDPAATADPLFDIPVEQLSERYEIMRHGGGGNFTQIICVVVRFDHVAAEDLVPLLPRVLQIDTWDDDEGGWLHSTLRFISREAKELRPGGETVITRLADILVSTYPLHSSCPDGEIALIYQLLVGQQMPIGCLGAVCFIANLSAKSTESPGISRQINRYQCGLTTRHVGAHY